MRASPWMRGLGVATAAALLGCNSLLGLDPGKPFPAGAGASGNPPASTTAGGTGGTGGGNGCPTVDGGACDDLVWANAYGDPATEHCAVTSMGVDAQGGIVIAGYFGPTLTFGTTLYALGATDYFLVKIDSTGQPVWAKHFGSAVNDSATFPLQIAVDATGQIALAGTANGAIDFGGGPLYGASKQTDHDVVVARFDDQGNHLWSHRYGTSPRPQVATQVAFSMEGDVLVGGWFQGQIDFGGGALPIQLDTAQNGFVARLDRDSGAHVWSHAIDTIQSTDVGALATGATSKTGTVLVAGTVDGAVEVGGVGGPTLAGSGVYLARFDDTGTYTSGAAVNATGSSHATAATFDRLGDVLVTGTFAGTMQLGDTPAINAAAGMDSFLLKLDPTGVPLWSMALPTTHVVVDAVPNVVLTGSFTGTVDLGRGTLTSAGGDDIILAKLDPSGAQIWARSFGDAGNQYGSAVAVVPGSNRIVFAGYGSGKVDFGKGAITGSAASNVFLAVFEP
jgi:hypothetical protein